MRDVTVSFVTTGVIQAVNIATGLLAARLLLPEGRGDLAAIMLWPGLIAELGIIGLSDALLYAAATRMASPRQLFASIVTLAALLAIVLTAIAIAVIPIVHADDTDEVRKIANWYAAYIGIYYAALFIHTMFQGHLDLLAWNWLRAIVPLGYVGFILVFVAAGHADVTGFALANLIAHVLAAGAGLALLARRGWLAWRPDLRIMKTMLIFGAKVHLGEMLNTVRQRLDQALVALWLSSSELGLYAVALTVANSAMILIHTAANVAYPKITQQETDGGKFEVLGRYMRLSVLVSLSVGFVLFVLAGWLVPLLFGRPFQPAVPVVHILLLGLPALAVKVMLMQALKAWNRSLLISHGELAGLVVAAASLLVLLPRYGLIGAAMSLVMAQIVAAIWMALSLRRERGFHLSSLLRPSSADWQYAIDLLERLRHRWR